MTTKNARRLSAPDGKEVRLVSLSGVSVRAAATADGPIGFQGHAAVFDSRIKIGGAWGWYEEIAPGAFDSALERGDDVRLLKNHNPDLILARTTAGNLRLSVDDVGLFTDADMTPTSYARDLALSLGAGDVSQMSFAFRVLKEEWSTELDDNGDDYEVRRILDVELFDVAPVTYPAYADTDASLRYREMELVCRSLGVDEPDARHAFVEALSRPDTDSELVSLRAAATRLTNRVEPSEPPASGNPGQSDAPDPEVIARDIRTRFLERQLRISA